MKARMDKYVSDDANTVKRRTQKNEKLYDEVLDMSIDYVNIDVNNAIELDPKNPIKSTREDYQKQRELSKILPRNEKHEKYVKEEVEPKENRIYDINEILRLAREDQLFEDNKKKRLINTEYNILTKLDIDNLESEDMKKEDLKSLINDIYEKEKPVKPKKYSRKDEEALLNDLFDDYEPDKDLKEELRLQEELSKEILDKKSLESPNLAKDEEPLKIRNKTFEEEIALEDSKKAKKKEEADKIVHEERDDEMLDEVKEGKGLLIAIIVVVILILLTGAFFVYEYFFGL